MNIPVEPLPRGIIIAATPLGNVGDASPRLAQALAQADVIAAEDTRRTRSLAAALGVEITGRVVSNFDHNEQDRVTQLLDAARTGTVVVVTDAGMPSVSDQVCAYRRRAHRWPSGHMLPRSFRSSHGPCSVRVASGQILL